VSTRRDQDGRSRRRRATRRGEAGDSDVSRREPFPIDRVLDAYLAAEGLGGLRLLDTIAGSWPEIVGETASQHSAPRSVKGSELVVAVDAPARVTELAFLAPAICDRLAELLGRRVIERVKGQVEGHFRLD
jgi:predicted nucleic acid-binding Zn ribbon protein